MPQIESFKIESQAEADDYLEALLKNEKDRSMDEVRIRADKFIKDDGLKNYFISKAGMLGFK